MNEVWNASFFLFRFRLAFSFSFISHRQSWFDIETNDKRWPMIFFLKTNTHTKCADGFIYIKVFWHVKIDGFNTFEHARTSPFVFPIIIVMIKEATNRWKKGIVLHGTNTYSRAHAKRTIKYTTNYIIIGKHYSISAHTLGFLFYTYFRLLLTASHTRQSKEKQQTVWTRERANRHLLFALLQKLFFYFVQFVFRTIRMALIVYLYIFLSVYARRVNDV